MLTLKPALALTPSCRHTATSSLCHLRVLRSSRKQQQKQCRLRVRAQEGGPGPQFDQKEEKEKQDKPREEGQTTAIITGAISIIIGVLYLGLVQFMNVRGGELLPPPPEAFDHAFD